MPRSLEYARPEPRDGALALPAFICGISSGPAAFGLAVFASVNHLPEITALAFVLGAAFAFACVVRIRLPDAAPARTRRFANVAVAAPIAWSIAFVLLLLHASS